MTHRTRVHTILLAATLATLGSSSLAHAQMAPSPGTWSGWHAGATLGAAILRDGTNNTVVFDKTLNGAFTDTILTAGGANAFSPGFCTGVPASNVPGAGCTQDTRGRDFTGRAGYDWQMGRFVIGAIGEVGTADLTDSLTAFSTTPASYTFTRELEWIGTVGLRAGIAGDRWLVHAGAGLAWAGLEQTFATSNTVNTFVRTAEDTAWGYQAGGGIDLRVHNRLTIGALYSYTSLMDEDRFTVRAQGPAAATNPFILTNPAGTDMQRADRMQWHAVRGVLSVRF